MNIERRDLTHAVVLEIEGRLTAAVAPQLRNEVADLVAAGRTNVAVDLAKVDFIDSSGLGALIGALKATRVAGGDLRIAAAGDQVKQVLRLTNLDKVLAMYPDAERAFDGS
ncbi:MULTISPECIES: STAS domain-containing protein [Microbacterium]|uniref:STAS domain-containing protein n=1 Tax=Microbacterium TaxID=33882 RepID=UPI00278704BD|nr:MULTISPECIES: STAS domain-containing protein [Microbacterium]MDQ1084549.1 anti-sigma B factor antagonist [Microbacterium sp. SORGH_AS_0344]MDQ1170173.1 anti-sigma B factor antagonist [Microbacterium proteolyticum]